MAIPALIAGGASLLGGWLANRGARQESARNRAFQEEMRSTSWQAGVEDMRAAGLNPALAYSQGGAASPGGSMASQSDALTPGIHSALAVNRQEKELKLVEAQMAKVLQEGRTAKAQADVEELRSTYLTKGRFPEDGSDGAPLLRRQVDAEVRRSIAEASRSGSMAEISGIGGQVAQGMGDLMPAFRRITSLAGEGANSVAGTLEFLERVARMRDAAVQAYVGFPKKVVLQLISRLRRN